MALIKCPECGKEISDKSSACVNCGYPLGELQVLSNPFFEREAEIIQTDSTNAVRTELQTTVHAENVLEIKDNKQPLDSTVVSLSKKKTWIVILFLAVLAIIAIISVICYNNYKEPEQDGMRFKKIYRADEYHLKEYVGSDSHVVIPSEINGIPVTGISEKAFYQCEKLLAIEIPETVTYIGERAFTECKNLKSIDIPSQVTRIGEYAFGWCSNLSEIVFVKSWGSFGLECALEEIKQGAFSHCSSLEYVTIPAQLKVLGDGAFDGCTNLKVVDFEKKSQLERIGSGAFYDCSLLKQISIPLSVEYIGRNAFSRCEKIETIEITPVEGWVMFHDEIGVVSGAPSKVPVTVLQDSAKTAYYLAGEFSKYAWERRE